MGFSFEQRGTTWVCRYDDESWPITLIARRVYHGTDRVITTMSLTRSITRGKHVIILTSKLDLQVHTQRTSFSKEAAARLAPATDNKPDALKVAIDAMIDGLLEKLVQSRDEMDVIEATDIVVPANLTPPYALWPMVPVSRPGMLVAPSGSGKSGTALMMAISTVTGHTFLPRLEPRVQGPVLYIGQEEDDKIWGARLEMICRGHQIERPKGLYYLKLRGDVPSLIESAERIAEMAATKRAVMVVIDSAQATWGEESDQIRGYTSRWFNAVAALGVSTLIVEHPNRETTYAKKGDSIEASGSSVKRDRVGHEWSLKSLGIPAAPGYPFRYNMTLTDTKRNYVPRQDDITYEVLIHGYEWMRFNEAEAVTAATVVESASRTADRIAAAMRFDDELRPNQEEEGWTVTDLKVAMRQKDDHRIRDELKSDYWRPAGWMPGVNYRFSQVPKTGSNGETNPARYVLETSKPAVQLSILPGDPEETN